VTFMCVCSACLSCSFPFNQYLTIQFDDDEEDERIRCVIVGSSGMYACVFLYMVWFVCVRFRAFFVRFCVFNGMYVMTTTKKTNAFAASLSAPLVYICVIILAHTYNADK
jgi:hypothetical protein